MFFKKQKAAEGEPAEEGNLLLLDEPTNHLDLPARESLEQALKGYEGTLVFVSHDRYFIAALADCIAEISGGKLNFFSVGYEKFREEKARLARAEEEERALAARAEYAEKKAAGYRSKKERAAEAAVKTRIKQIEAEISSIESEEADVQALLADPVVTSDYKKVEELCSRLSDIKSRQEELYAEYEKLI